VPDKFPLIEALRDLRAMTLEEQRRWRRDHESDFPSETRRLLYRLWRLDGVMLEPGDETMLLLYEMAQHRDKGELMELLKTQNDLLQQMNAVLKAIQVDVRALKKAPR
jgi:hypothetical protein